MPELPEVETTARGIAPHLLGQRVTDVRVRQGRLREPVPADLGACLGGQVLQGVSRRAKYLLLDFGHGRLLVHLGMSGSLRIVPAGTEPLPHDHVDLVFGAQVLRYRDPRRFGLMRWIAAGEAEPAVLAHLGVEPLSDAFTGPWLHAASRGARRAIKLFLMDSHVVVGVGNIYASESLFRAGIHPLTPAGRLGPARCERLVGAVRDTLTDAIAAGGSSLRDFVGGDGQPGYFQQQYFVYGRDDAPCRRCGQPVRKQTIGQRSSFFCPRCQRR
jgi:formamidopyrimidine-DNA glycosylase